MYIVGKSSNFRKHNDGVAGTSFALFVYNYVMHAVHARCLNSREIILSKYVVTSYVQYVGGYKHQNLF